MLNYGVIGCGAVFEVFQVNALLQTPGLNLLSVCDINQERLSKIQRKYNIPRGYTDYHELLQDKDIDVVMINLPQHLHREIALKSAQAGKPYSSCSTDLVHTQCNCFPRKVHQVSPYF